MTITIRVQYKGEAARKLAADGQARGENDPPLYAQDVSRALSLFSIPPPDNTRAIWKSGFVLCNYNITRDNNLFDRIELGARRAQSIACKTTLDGLCISFIHLFENAKPIFFSSKQQKQIVSPGPAGPSYQSRRRSDSPPRQFKSHARPLGEERSLPNLTGHTKVEYVPRNRLSSDKPTGNEFRQSDQMSQSATPALGQLDLAQEALKQLSASSTIQALLRGKPSTDDGSIKQEIPPSPTMQSYASSYLLPPERNGHVSAVSSASNAAQPSSSGSGHPEEIRVPQGRVSRFETSYAQRRLSPPTREERNVAMYGDLTTNETAVTAPSPFRRPLNPPSGQTPARRSYWRLDQSITPASSVPMKRQLSPVSRHRGPVSPPLKKRFAESEASPPRLLIEPRADMDKRLSSPPPYKRSASPAENKRLSLLTKAASATSTTTPVPNDTVGPNAGTSLSKQRELFLNRELWDVRRQITALRARETKILDELGRDHAPEPAESLAAKNGPFEDKSKVMEAENRSLRDQLQRETLRRKLVEEACENERRRRKLAEDTLDDARREYDEPLVVPAMMDAFERIAQLTGDALMAVDDQKMV